MKYACFFYFFALTVVVNANDGIGWRSDGTGIYTTATGPYEWSSNKNVIWKTDIKSFGNATPVIVNNKIFITQEPDMLLCVSLNNGEILWTRNISPEDGNRPRTHGTTGYKSPTPVTDGQFIYILNGYGILAKYDFDGEQLWLQKTAAPTHNWGHSASPVIYDGKLITHVSRELAAYNPETGEVLWKTTLSYNSNWGTPLKVMMGGAEAGVITTSGHLVRLSDGKVMASDLYSLPYGSPTVSSDKTIAYITDEKGSKAIRFPAVADDKCAAETIWSKDLVKHRFYAAPLVHDGLLYTVSQKGHVFCLDADTGEILWSKEEQMGRGEAYPSIVLLGDKVLVSHEAGKTFVYEFGREYKAPVFVNNIGAFRATPVSFDNNKLLIRTNNALYCLGATE